MRHRHTERTRPARRPGRPDRRRRAEQYAEPYFSKEPGWAEQKPNFYFDRLCECCRELCARSNALLPDVIAMTITVIRDTVVCLDANNEPLRDIFSGWISAPLTRTAPCLSKT